MVTRLNFQIQKICMKRTTILAFCVAATGLVSAQQVPAEASVVPLLKLDLGLQGVGLQYEAKVSNSFTAEVASGISGGYIIDRASLTYHFDFFQPSFYFSLTPKYFYNRTRRFLRNRSLTLNSGNYFGFRIRYVTPGAGGESLTENSLLTNLHWGIQRSIGKSWTVNVHGGVGYAQQVGSTFNSGTWYPALDLRFAYIFLKKE